MKNDGSCFAAVDGVVMKNDGSSTNDFTPRRMYDKHSKETTKPPVCTLEVGCPGWDSKPSSGMNK